MKYSSEIFKGFDIAAVSCRIILLTLDKVLGKFIWSKQ